MNSNTQLLEFPLTMLPFIYDPNEWIKSPKIYLSEYALINGFQPTIFSYRELQDGQYQVYQISVLVGGQKYSINKNFNSLKIAEHNICILALLNIYGVCSNAIELQQLIDICTSKISDQFREHKKSQKPYNLHTKILKPKIYENNTNGLTSNEHNLRSCSQNEHNLRSCPQNGLTSNLEERDKLKNIILDYLGQIDSGTSFQFGSVIAFLKNRNMQYPNKISKSILYELKNEGKVVKLDGNLWKKV